MTIATAPPVDLDPGDALTSPVMADSRSAGGRPSRAGAGVGGPRFAHLPGLTLMVVILTSQAALSARLLKANTAFGDEALDVWAGHLEWAHWLHGASTPAFHSWFSGVPEIYPPLAALADNLGGLTAARILSLCFMLAATCLLRGTASRLYGKPAGYYAAALFALIGPTLYVGAIVSSDAMSLFLLSVGAWCACGSRNREDATGWMVAAAAAVVLANAITYATALFDPIVVVMAVLSGFPEPGGKSALRRGALFVTIVVTVAAIVLRIGGSGTFADAGQTAIMGPAGATPELRVLGDSWPWVAVVSITALGGLLLSKIRREPGPISWLTAALVITVLLPPAEHALMRTTVALSQHVDVGSWFACIAGGYAVSQFQAWIRTRRLRFIAAGCVGAAIVPLAAAGLSQAHSMINWPGVAPLITFLRDKTDHGGRFLAETDDVMEYYLPDTSWRQWSNTFSITLPNGRMRAANGDPAFYVRAIRQHYFSLIILSYAETPDMDRAIARALRATTGYRVIGNVAYGGPATGIYTIWAYRPRAVDGGP